MSEYTSNKYICMYVSLQSSCINYCLLFSILCFRSRCVSFSAAICVLLSVRPSVCLSHSPAVAVALQLLLCCSGCCCCNNNNNIYAIHMACLPSLCCFFESNTSYIYMYLFHMRATNEEEQQTKNKRINKRRCKTHTHRHTRTRTQGQRRRAMGCSATKIGSSRQQWQ